MQTINYDQLKEITHEKKMIQNIKKLMIRNTSKYFVNKNFVNNEKILKNS